MSGKTADRPREPADTSQAAAPVDTVGTKSSRRHSDAPGPSALTYINVTRGRRFRQTRMSHTDKWDDLLVRGSRAAWHQPNCSILAISRDKRRWSGNLPSNKYRLYSARSTRQPATAEVLAPFSRAPRRRRMNTQRHTFGAAQPLKGIARADLMPLRSIS